MNGLTIKTVETRDSRVSTILNALQCVLLFTYTIS
jgi:hypothetical protein